MGTSPKEPFCVRPVSALAGRSPVLVPERRQEQLGLIAPLFRGHRSSYLELMKVI